VGTTEDDPRSQPLRCLLDDAMLIVKLTTQ